MTDKTTEQQAGEVRELLDELLSGGGRRGAFDGALLVLSRALSPEAEDFGTLITEAFYTLGKAIVLRGGLSHGYAVTANMFADLAATSVFIAFASMPALAEGMNKARALRGEAPIPTGKVAEEALRDFADGVKAGVNPVPETEPPMELSVLPNGLVTLHPKDAITPIPETHWMDMSGAVPLEVKM